jgi:hypothetical protein
VTHSLAVEGNNPELRKTDPKRANSLLGRTKHFKDSFISTVASSPVPTQHISSVNRVVGGINFEEENVQGEYDAGKSSLHLRSNLNTVVPKVKSSSYSKEYDNYKRRKDSRNAKHTIMHELGHHATLPPLSNTHYENSSQAGHYEAEADNYADKYPAKGQKIGPTGYDKMVNLGYKSKEFSNAHKKNRIRPPKINPFGGHSHSQVIMARDWKNRNNEPLPDMKYLDGPFDDRVEALYKSQKTKKQRAERKYK